VGGIGAFTEKHLYGTLPEILLLVRVPPIDIHEGGLAKKKNY